MRVKVKRMHPDARVPQQAYKDDYGYDCYAVSEEEVAPNVWKYGLGIALQMDRESYDINKEANLCISARPRSSVWKTGMVLSNCIGTIDESYTGEISAVFYHVMPQMPRYKVGDKICQIHLDGAWKIKLEEVESLDETERGAGGYGSTGR